MSKKCNPSTYAVVTPGGTVTYGFRCAAHQIFTKRYATRELRDQRLREHQKSAKKS